MRSICTAFGGNLESLDALLKVRTNTGFDLNAS